MIQWSPEVTVGNILTIVSFIATGVVASFRVYHLLDKRIAVFENILQGLKETLNGHNERMDKYENVMRIVTGDLQRVIGHIEVSDGWTHKRRSDQ